METVHIKTSTEYDVLIGRGLLAQLGTLAKTVSRGDLAMLVTDDNVHALYAAQALASLQAAGFRTEVFSFAPAETSKTAQTWLSLMERLAEFGMTRSGFLVALGGGTVSDLAGFAAATYLRGIDYINVPTTLLAMTDASVGGKTGIDLPQGKNLVGAFRQPRLVICDPDTLDTLPAGVLADGFAEVIKYGMIGDAELLTQLKAPFAPQAEKVICRCVSQKRTLVEQDERDDGIRRLLNFGHTIGHAIETVSEYRISHGKAVAIGMAAMTRLAEHTGDCADGVFWELYDLLSQYGLPTELPYDAQTLWQAAFADKKRQDDTLALVVPMRRGQCTVRKVTMEDYCAMLEVCERL